MILPNEKKRVYIMKYTSLENTEKMGSMASIGGFTVDFVSSRLSYAIRPR